VQHLGVRIEIVKNTVYEVMDKMRSESVIMGKLWGKVRITVANTNY